MADNYSRNVLRIVIAQLSQAVGFDSIQSSSLEILTNLLERYLHHIGKTIHDYGEQRGEAVPDLDDLYFAFRQLGISLPEIADYTKQIESVKFAHNVAQFPAPKQTNLGFPTSFEPDDLKRDEHIPLHMPSMVTSSLKPAEPQTDNAVLKKDSFVIAKKNPQNFSSDEEIYSAGDDSSDGEYLSDDSLSYNHSKTRHLTKPEDIPMVEGTAPSSLMSVPSVSELDDGNSFTTASRKNSLDKFEGDADRSRTKERHTIGSKTSARADVPWMTRDEQGTGKRKTIDSESRSGHSKSTDPSWLSEKKKPADVYDPGWLQEEDSSLVHLNKPPTPDVPRSSTSSEKRSWFSKDKQASPDMKLAKPFSQKHGTSSKYSKHKSSSASSSHKHNLKANADRKPSHHKSYKTPPNAKKAGADEQIKARIEAAERLLHSAPVPPYVPASPKSHNKKSQHAVKKSPAQSETDAERKTKKASTADSSHYQPAKSSSVKQKAASKTLEDKQDRSNFASSESMMKAIDAVISRASEESVRQDKEAEEADLMKFSHLVKESSSSESESDYVVKAEQMLQLEERGLQGTRPASPTSSSISSIDTPASLSDSDSNDSIEIPPKIPEPPPAKEKVKKEKRKKKSKRKDEKSPVVPPPKNRPKGKKSKQKHASFVTTETITPIPVKMKVKLKPMPKEPKLFDVAEDKDRIKITHPPAKPHKEEKTKQKESKHSKHKASAAKTSSETKRDTPEHAVGKIILKKSKSGDAKVVKPKAKEHARSPSPVSSRSNLPLPKLSAAVPVTSVTLTTKEKKKSKKEKKKKREKERDSEKDRGVEREKHSEKTSKESKDKSGHHKESKDSKAARKSPYDSDGASPLVPKLTLKMGASEKKFVIKPPSASAGKVGAKKRPHSGNDSPKPVKERKISVDCVKTVSEGFAAAVERKVITQTISVGPVGVYEDGDGNMVWICPGCNKQDDGSPMIGCDMCDDWYHWPCVKITQEPPDDVDWYCPRCTKRQQLAAKGKVSVKKKKKK